MRLIQAAVFSAYVTVSIIPASATSLIGRDQDDIRNSLGMLFVATVYCARNIQVQHNAVDLVWDILQLSTGIDPDSEEGKEAVVPYVNAAEAEAKADSVAFCQRIARDYGPQGVSIAGLVMPR